MRLLLSFLFALALGLESRSLKLARVDLEVALRPEQPRSDANAAQLRVVARSFRVKRDEFMKDGERFLVRAGELHYFRVPPQYHRDRLQRMKALGLNAVSMYVAWNYHEEVEGQVARLEELTGFLDAVKAEGMLALLRPGPYICAEWDMGGLPSWLLWGDKAGIKLRTYEPIYIAAVDKWFRTLYRAVSSYSYAKGGPIAMLQIENEYGYFGNCRHNPEDAKYMNHLLGRAMEFFGTGVVYTTADNPDKLERGSPWKHDDRVLATVDGGLDTTGLRYARGFQLQRTFNAPGHSPKMWSELWTGWFTPWNAAHAASESRRNFFHGIDAMVRQDASFSMYMVHGGTDFGFWSGVNGNRFKVFNPDLTSYDYSSPISEAGDHNVGSDGGDLFEGIQSAMGAIVEGVDEPRPNRKAAYGRVELKEEARVFDYLDALATCIAHVDAGALRFPSFEELRHDHGFVLYTYDGDVPRTKLRIEANMAHDRVQVFVGHEEVGTAYRPECPATFQIPSGRGMSLLVENMGRINFGADIDDLKGYLGTPPVKSRWTARCLPLKPEQVKALPFSTPTIRSSAASSGASSGPVFRRGYLHVGGGSSGEQPVDTFLDTRGFSKGYVWVNGINLGRFWETAGPQHTLYVPAPFLNEGKNEVIVLDLHGSAARCIDSVAAPRYE